MQAARIFLSLSARQRIHTKTIKWQKGRARYHLQRTKHGNLQLKNYMHGATRAGRRISTQFGEFTKRETHFLRPQIIQHYAAPAFPHLTVWLELVKHANDSLLLLLMDVR
jgi:hypothetical protein